MPPKKDKDKKAASSKKPGKEKASVIIDGLPIAAMTREQVEGHVIRLRDELTKEREERNFFQLERDKLQTFWEVSKQQLDEKKAELRNRESDLEQAEERHFAEIKVFKQNIQYHVHDHQSKLSDAKTENLAALKSAQDDHQKNETALLEEKRSIKKALRDQDKMHQNVLQALRLKNSEDLANMKLEFQRKVAELEGNYESKMKAIRSELEKRRKLELQELDERKNHQISNLIRNHDKAFVDIKIYYNDITVNNLALITTLKEQISTMKAKEDRLEKQLSDVVAENKKLTAPLEKAQIQVAELTKQMTKYDRDKVILASTKTRLKHSMQEIKDLKWEQEVLEQKFKQMQAERDELHSKFVSAIEEVQQKSTLKNVLLEQKLQTLEDIVVRKDAQLIDAITSSNLEPAASIGISKQKQVR